MVALHIPRPAHDELPGPVPPRPAAPSTPRLVVVRERPARSLPDRATRIRRRRLAVLVSAVMLVALVGTAARVATGLVDVGTSTRPDPVADPAGVDGPAAGDVYVVQPGDTLWSIAEDIAPGSDPRAVVDELRAANGDPVLEVGDRLTLAID